MSVARRILETMVAQDEVDEVTVIEAALELWDETGLGVAPSAIAARLGIDEDLVQRLIKPFANAEFFGNVLRGDDVAQVVREPTAATRRLVGR